MSILDRVTKAVGDAVDRGKKEVDQFVRIQKINSQISDIEGTISQCKARIQEHTLKIGQMTVEMLRAGKIASPEMQGLLDQITDIERGIVKAEGEIAGKKAEIEKIKAEESQAKNLEAPAAEAQPVTPPPIPTAAARFCPQCGAQVKGSGAFCSECGAKLT
jgi:predicted  nucleic acid-binding Zn-ribbon protein